MTDRGFRTLVRILILAMPLGLPGCGGGSPTGSTTPTPTPTTAASTKFTGTIAGNKGQSGTLVITVAAQVTTASKPKAMEASVATATLTLIDGGGTFSLTGTFDSSTGALDLSGGGFSLTGSINHDQVTGTYTGPNGIAGGFTNLDSTRNTVTTYCGTYIASHDSGVWNLEVASDGTASGAACPTSGTGQAVTLSGTLSGTNVHFTTSDAVDVTGTIENGKLSCSFIDHDGFHGTCSGSVC